MAQQQKRGWRSRLFGRSEPTQQFGATVNGVSVLDLDDVFRVMSGSLGQIVITREAANRLAVVTSIRNRVCAVIAAMPLEQRRKDGTVVDNRWLKSPNPFRPLVNEMTDTVADMYYDGAAAWLITKRGPSATLGPGRGFPLASRWVPYSDWKRDPSAPSTFIVEGKEVPADDVLVFAGLHKGILHEGPVSAINDALRLERFAAVMTASPFPLGYFQTRENSGLAAEDVRDFLRKWTELRSRNAWAAVPEELELKTVELDAGKLQLGEARKETTKNIAMGGGANLEDVGVSTTSRVYFNATQVRKDLLDFQIAQYTEPIAQRLSMPDVTPTGHVVKFSADNFLSVDELTRNQIYEIGLRTGVYADANEVRAEEGKPPLTPEQQAEREKDRAARQQPQQQPPQGGK